MTIRLFDRIATLVRADAHGVVDALEERSLLLKQYVREAEIELNQKRARLAAAREEEARLAEAVARREEEIRGLDEDIALALEGEQDDLARFAIRRLLPRRDEAAALQSQLEQRRKQIEALAQRIAEQESQFESLEVRVRAELAAGRESSDAPPWLGETAVADEEVEIELMRRRQAMGGDR